MQKLPLHDYSPCVICVTLKDTVLLGRGEEKHIADSQEKEVMTMFATLS